MIPVLGLTILSCWDSSILTWISLKLFSYFWTSSLALKILLSRSVNLVWISFILLSRAFSSCWTNSMASITAASAETSSWYSLIWLFSASWNSISVTVFPRKLIIELTSFWDWFHLLFWPFWSASRCLTFSLADRILASWASISRSNRSFSVTSWSFVFWSCSLLYRSWFSYPNFCVSSCKNWFFE